MLREVHTLWKCFDALERAIDRQLARLLRAGVVRPTAREQIGLVIEELRDEVAEIVESGDRLNDCRIAGVDERTSDSNRR